MISDERFSLSFFLAEEGRQERGGWAMGRVSDQGAKGWDRMSCHGDDDGDDVQNCRHAELPSRFPPLSCSLCLSSRLTYRDALTAHEAARPSVACHHMTAHHILDRAC